MHSPRVLGAIALGAIVTAAISFAVVDVSVAAECSAACGPEVPIIPMTFAALGALALLVSVLPAIAWIVEAVKSNHAIQLETDRELSRLVRATRDRVEEET